MNSGFSRAISRTLFVMPATSRLVSEPSRIVSAPMRSAAAPSIGTSASSSRPTAPSPASLSGSDSLMPWPSPSQKPEAAAARLSSFTAASLAESTRA